jgi:hypothetical protein
MSVTYHDILAVFYTEIQKEYGNIEAQPYTIKNSPNQEEKIIEIYNDEKKIISTKYELLGIYDESTNLFLWGNSLVPSDKTESIRVRDILEYSKKIKALILNKKFTDIGFLEKMLYYLSSPIIYVLKENISQLIMLCVFISKKIILMRRDANTNIVTFYLIVDVLSY